MVSKESLVIILLGIASVTATAVSGFPLNQKVAAATTGQGGTNGVADSRSTASGEAEAIT